MQKRLLLAFTACMLGFSQASEASCGYNCGSNLEQLRAYSPYHQGNHYYYDRTPRYLNERLRDTSSTYGRHYYYDQTPRYLSERLRDSSPQIQYGASNQSWKIQREARNAVPRGDGWSWNPSTFLK